jgi:hypothetical protein
VHAHKSYHKSDAARLDMNADLTEECGKSAGVMWKVLKLNDL